MVTPALVPTTAAAMAAATFRIERRRFVGDTTGIVIRAPCIDRLPQPGVEPSNASRSARFFGKLKITLTRGFWMGKGQIL